MKFFKQSTLSGQNEGVKAAEAQAGASAGADAAAGERVVVSGMSGLFPGAENVDDLKRILYNGINPVTSENCRWNFNHPEVRNHIGKVSGLEYFDAQFFKVYYQLGNNMDAMARKLLEQTYQAIYDAGLSPEHLYGRKIGVYMGSCFAETEKTFYYASKGVNGLSIAASSKTMFANRVSYYLNAKGPSMSIDVACSSSITALQLAYQHITTGECEAAIVGGSNICLHPQSIIHFGRIMKLSKDGKTRSFDENADGCAKSEAINVLFLQKAKDALRIYAEVVHVNSQFTSLLTDDGFPRYGFYRDPSSSVTFLKEFYDKVNVLPHEVEYVEACGTAEPEADKQELEALDEVYCKGRKNPLLIGSVMSNVGYTEAASGITALTKVLLGYHTGSLAGNLHCEFPRGDVSGLSEGRLRVLTKNTAFGRGYAAVNSLSVTGVNGHVLLRGHHKPKDLSRYKSSIPHLVVTSGRQESSVDKVFQHLKAHPVDPEQIALLNNIHLTHIPGNLARGFLILDNEEGTHTVSMSERVEYFDYVKRPLWFVYSGMGSQWAGMGAQLMLIPTFAAAINKAKQYFTAGQLLKLFKAQVRPHMEYCFHLRAGAPKYQLHPFDSVEKRAVRIVNDLRLTDRLEPLSFRRDIGSLCVFYRLYYGPGLLKYLREVIKTPKRRSERWLSTSVPKERWGEESAQYSSAEYHTNNLLSSVLFEETSRLIPADAIVVEVAPHGLLQAILKRSLPASCKNIPLTRRGHSHSVAYFLEAIGMLYMMGFNPKIENLYPKIEFPVSTETPMLSHLVEWVHREKWSLPLHLLAYKKMAAAVNYIISIHDDEHAFLQGHVIREATVYPFSAALVAVWDALCMSLEKPRRQSAVRFRDVTLHAQPALHTRRQLRLSVELHRGSGRFQVKDDLDSKVADGYISEDRIENLKCVETLKDIESDELNVTSIEIYDYFYSRDMNYQNEFRSIHSTNLPVTKAHIQWRGNWVTFIDALIQLNTLRHPHSTYSRPNSIKDLFIDPEQFRNKSVLPATVVQEQTIRCGGVTMEELKFHDLPEPVETSCILKSLKFVPHIGSDPEVIFDKDEDPRMKKSTGNDVPAQSALVGPLKQLHWAQVPAPAGPGVAVKVQYAGLNSFDLKKSIGMITSTKNCDGEQNTAYGMDFSGITESGMRVMGLVQSGAARSHVVARPELLWPVPAHWSLQDAATVPLAYCLAYYCLIGSALKSRVYPGMRVLVHGGAGALGQALIAIALAYGCEVFTTVSDTRKKQFLLKLFPTLKEKNIYNSRDPTFSDQVLDATNAAGVHIIISNLSRELKDVSMHCLTSFGYNIDVAQLPNRDNYVFGMYHLEKDRNYCCVDINSIFKEENSSIMKKLQLAVAEGIANGCVRPLSRVTYQPQQVHRAFRLLAAGNQRGRVLIQMQQNSVNVQRQLACCSDRSHVIISDNQGFGQQLADKLISRGVRQLYLYLPLSPNYYQLKIRYLRDAGVQVRYETLSNPKNIPKILNDRHLFGTVEGVYVFSSNKKTALEWTSFLNDIDRISKLLYSNTKYFAVINTGEINEEGINMLKMPSPFAGTIIILPELDEIGTESETRKLFPSAVMTAIEKALINNKRGVLQAHFTQESRVTLLQQLSSLLEIEFPDDRNPAYTLSDLGLSTAKLNSVCVFLQDNYNICLSMEAIQALTAERIIEIEEILTKTAFDNNKGLTTLFSKIDSDEIMATTDMVYLPTLANSSATREDEWDTSDGYRCITVVPGLEGQHARFCTLCERLKLPALLLQPPINRPNDNIQQIAHTYVQIMLKKANIRNNFYLVGYQSGVLIALEMAAILEDNGYTGTVFCIGSPEEIKMEIREHLKEFKTEEALQDGIVMHMFGLMCGDGDHDELQAALQRAPSWDKKVEIAVRRLTGLTAHSAQYAQQLIESAYGRVVQLMQAELHPHPLRSRVLLMRPTSSQPLPPRWPRFEAEFPLAAPLAEATEDLRCANIINAHLDADILETFAKKNLCEFYLCGDDIFKMG